MRIGGIQRSSLVDYPGKVCAVIFTQGCNFRCPYCHNPQLVEPSLFEQPLDVADVLSFLESRVGCLNGVVVSGGEPLLHGDLLDLLARVRSLGFPVKLDTNGSLPERLQTAIDERLVDFVAMDIKAPFSKYPEIAGVQMDIGTIGASIRIIRESGINHQFRTTASAFLDADDYLNIRQLCGHTPHYIVQTMNKYSAMPDAFQYLRGEQKLQGGRYQASAVINPCHKELCN